MKRGEAGVTLIEILVAVSLLSLLSLGMVMAIRAGLGAYGKVEEKLMFNRRVAGAQRIAQQELEGLLPAFATCGGGGTNPGQRAVLFEGQPDRMWLVSTFSLEGGWRGRPQILELFVIPGETSGVRLAVNEFPYTGERGAGQYCGGSFNPPGSIARLAVMNPVPAGPQTFILADHLAFCRFWYYTPVPMSFDPPTWQPQWAARGWPLAVRIEMASEAPDPAHLRPITVTAPIHVNRNPEKVYTDAY